MTATAACRCGATVTDDANRPAAWFVGLDGTTGVCPACLIRRTPSKLLETARDALRAVGVDVPNDATPDEILALAGLLMEGHRR
jgi:hypothetical protein